MADQATQATSGELLIQTFSEVQRPSVSGPSLGPEEAAGCDLQDDGPLC